MSVIGKLVNIDFLIEKYTAYAYSQEVLENFTYFNYQSVYLCSLKLNNKQAEEKEKNNVN